MELIAAFAITVFLLGLSFGLLSKQARKRRALLKQIENKSGGKQNNPESLDKPFSHS